jgi:hypothetical protein
MTMTKSIVLSCVILLFSGLSAAQTNGQATVIYGYATTGGYGSAGPLVTTPSISLVGPPLQVGISDEAQDNDNSGSATDSSRPFNGFDSGAARSDDSYGAAELAARFRPRKAVKVYTNQDVVQVNDTNGLVKFGNKTEHL